MRNTIMQEKLSSVLSAGSGSEASSKAKAASNGSRVLKKAEKPVSAAAAAPVLGPRYVPPAKRSNPFRVHAFSTSEPPMPETESIAAESEIPAILVDSPAPELVLAKVQQSKEGNQFITAPVQPASEQDALVSFPEIPLQAVQPADPAAVEASAAEAPALEAPGEAISETLVPFVPPDLSWLEKQTPFSDSLKAMVDHLRDAKSHIAFSMEQERTQQKKLEEELFAVQYRIEQQRESLRQIDDTISACALVAEQSAGIEPTLLAARRNHAKPEKPTKGATGRWSVSDASMCRQADIVKFFTENLGTNWTSAEIREQLPAGKRAHAKHYLPVLLATMCRDGKIQRISFGIYRLAGL